MTTPIYSSRADIAALTAAEAAEFGTMAVLSDTLAEAWTWNADSTADAADGAVIIPSDDPVTGRIVAAETDQAGLIAILMAFSQSSADSVTLADGRILVGGTDNTGQAVPMSGDGTIDDTGKLTITKTGGALLTQTFDALGAADAALASAKKYADDAATSNTLCFPRIHPPTTDLFSTELADNGGTGTFTASDRAFSVSRTDGGASSGDAYYAVCKPIPTDDSWDAIATLTIPVTGDGSSYYVRNFLALIDSSTGNALCIGLNGQGGEMALVYSFYTAASHNLPTSIYWDYMFPPAFVTVKFSYDGTTLTGYASFDDGTSWHELGSATVSDYLTTPDYIGIMAESYGTIPSKVFLQASCLFYEDPDYTYDG